MSLFASKEIPVFVKTLMGLEEVLAGELKELDARDVHIGRRGVACVTDEEGLYRILVHSRIAIRVLVRLAEHTVGNEQELYDWAKSIGWEDYLSVKNTLAVDVVSFHPEMNHTVFLAQKTKDAIVDRFRELYDQRPSVNPKDPDVRINLHISKDGASHIALDASGRAMNQRGYRTHTGKAAINEVLAAGLIALSLWDPETPFVDPMCGSGTFLIEAAMIAKRRAPALLNDSFGLKRWPHFRESLWSRLVREAKRSERRDVDWIYGGDRDPRMIEISQQNIKNARLTHNITLVNKPFDKLWIPEGNGVIISNPPYGEHIGERKELRKMYEELGRVLRYKAVGYKAYFITPDREFRKAMPMKPGKVFHVLNGSIPCEYISYSIGPKR
ncbi:MAG: THUMP domain-containing protein [Cyclonatronaceae bacterium]